MRFRSKPHTIEGFRFRRNGVTDVPEWFIKALETGRVMTTINHKECFVSMYDVHGGCRKAYDGDWVCMNQSGTIFPLTDEEFQRGFEADG